MTRFLTSLLALSATVVSVSATPAIALEERATVGDTFSLFAYGSASDTTIGGFPIYYGNGFAYIVNPSKVNVTSAYVTFTKNSSDQTQWLANPKSDANSTAFTDAAFYVPIPTGPTGFYTSGVSNISTDSIITTGFKFYGTLAMLKIDSSLYTLWYAVPTGTDGLWSVGWNATSDMTSAELITVKAVNPPNVVFDKRHSSSLSYLN